MSVLRLIAIAFIFACVSVAWLILGASVQFRTGSGYADIGRQVQELWGTPQTQMAPLVYITRDSPAGRGTFWELDSSKINVALQLKHRQKGLLWYSTYDVNFDALYAFHNPTDKAEKATVEFTFPSQSAIYDNFVFTVKGDRAQPSGDLARGAVFTLEVAPGEKVEVRVAYRSRGLDRWAYRFGQGVSNVKDFALTVDTDFKDINFPNRSISASTKAETPQGWRLQWRFENLVSGFEVGVEMPRKLNPGPLAARISFFAPVSLFFFFTVLVVLGAVTGVNLHPMHYFFLGAAFFSFHLLFAYLADQVPLAVAFVISAAVSLTLVITYLGRVESWRFALREAGLSQFLFLVLFSYAFFFEGYTGLAITIGAIVTLAVLMQVTARVNWDAAFGKSRSEASRPGGPAAR
ncbi:MAG: inner membrane CreD family protein [Chloroflexota bacterium]